MTLLNYPWTLTAGQREDANKLVENFEAIRGVVNGAVDEANLGDIKFADSKLASPLNATPRLVMESTSTLGPLIGPGRWVFQDNARVALAHLDISGGAPLLAAVCLPQCPPLVPKLELVVSYMVSQDAYNPQAPGQILSFHLTPIASVGGSDSLTAVLGTDLATVIFGNPPALSAGTTVMRSGLFDPPGGGVMTFSVTASRATGATFLTAHAALYQRFVEA